MSRGRRVVDAIVARSKYQIVSIFLASLFFLLAFSVSAQYGQYGQYGAPAPSKAILIEKLVGKPSLTKGGATDTTFVDNLSVSDPRFSPQQEVLFKLVVKNTSDVTLSNVEVKDFVPDFLEPVEGPGTFDSASRTITFNAGDFAVNEEKTYFLRMRFVSQDRLPSDKGILCLVNKAEARTSEVFDEDTAQLCLEKEVVGAPQQPSAGPEAGLVLLAFNALAAGAGIWLRKRK